MAHHCRPLSLGEEARSRSSADYEFLPSHCTAVLQVVQAGTMVPYATLLQARMIILLWARILVLRLLQRLCYDPIVTYTELRALLRF